MDFDGTYPAITKFFYDAMFYSNWLVILVYLVLFNRKGRHPAQAIPQFETGYAVQKVLLLIVAGIGYFFYAFDTVDPARALDLPYRGFDSYPLFILALALGTVLSVPVFSGILLWVALKPGENFTILTGLLLSYIFFHFENIPYSICMIPHVYKYYGVVTTPLSILAGAWVIVGLVRFAVDKANARAGSTDVSRRRLRFAGAVVLLVSTAGLSYHSATKAAFLSRPRYQEGVGSGIRDVADFIGKGVLIMGPTRTGRSVGVPLLAEHDLDTFMLYKVSDYGMLAEQIGRWGEQGRKVYAADISMDILYRLNAYVSVEGGKVFPLLSEEMQTKPFSLSIPRRREVMWLPMVELRFRPGTEEDTVHHPTSMTVGTNDLGSIRQFRAELYFHEEKQNYYRAASESSYVRLAKPTGHGPLALKLTLNGAIRGGELGRVVIRADGHEIAALDLTPRWEDYTFEIDHDDPARNWVEIEIHTVNPSRRERKDWDMSVIDYNEGLDYGVFFCGAGLVRG